MIADKSELKVMLGLYESITLEEEAVLLLLHGSAEDAVKKHLGYDPEQFRRTEFYPRVETFNPQNNLGAGGYWDRSGSSAIFRPNRTSEGGVIITERIPLREIHDLRVDWNAKAGQSTDAFAANTAWTEGEEFWGDYEQARYAESGIIHSHGSWPNEPGTVRIDYTAGYSRLELSGLADETTASDTYSQISNARVDASGIKRAVMLTVVRAFQNWSSNKKNTKLGMFAGVLKSERLQDYSYTLGNAAESLASGLTRLSPEAEESLEKYVHYGIALT